MESLVETIWAECDKMGLLYDRHHLPIKIGPDCYMLYAVEASAECHNKGHCTNKRYYALTGGSEVRIYEN